VNADDLDRTYALLSQAMTRVQTSDMDLFLARLALLLLAASDDPGAVARAIADAEADLPLAGREDGYAG
jgi:hypothetical protein